MIFQPVANYNIGSIQHTDSSVVNDETPTHQEDVRADKFRELLNKGIHINISLPLHDV